jgi:hypothetical protein
MGVVITRNSQLHGDGGDCEPLNLGRQVISFALTLKSNKTRTNLANAAKRHSARRIRSFNYIYIYAQAHFQSPRNYLRLSSVRCSRGVGPRDRDVLLTPKLLDTLREYWRWMKPRTYLFPGTVNNWRADVPITEKIVWTAVAEAAKQAGITKHISPQTLRHSRRFIPDAITLTSFSVTVIQRREVGRSAQKLVFLGRGAVRQSDLRYQTLLRYWSSLTEGLSKDRHAADHHQGRRKSPNIGRIHLRRLLVLLLVSPCSQAADHTIAQATLKRYTRPGNLCYADVSIVTQTMKSSAALKWTPRSHFRRWPMDNHSEFPRMGACGSASLLLKDPDCTLTTIRAAALTGAVDIALGIYNDAAPRTAAVVAAGEVVQVRKGPRALHKA